MFDNTQNVVEKEGAQNLPLDEDVESRPAAQSMPSNLENAAFLKISAITGLHIIRDVKPSPDSKVIFDGIALDGINSYRIFEVKVIGKESNYYRHIKSVIRYLSLYFASLPSAHRREVKVTIIVVTTSDFNGSLLDMSNFFASVIKECDFTADLVLFKENELEEYMEQAGPSVEEQCVLDGDVISFTTGGPYEIALNRCDTPEKILDLVDDLCSKQWMTKELLQRFVGLACMANNIWYKGIK